MTGPKTNEGARKKGDDTGTRAQVRYLRSSASKARVVLDLIRGLDVKAADDLLSLAERDIAIVIRKCLASAIANAVENDQQSADELFVSACFADEGPTLKRFRPRARGRAGSIKKRTCHITVIVKRLSDEQLEIRRRAEEARPDSTRARRGAAAQANARRERVAQSRKAAAKAERKAADSDHDHDHDHDHTPAAFVGELPAGAAAPLADGSAPEGFTIKGNADSMLYHTTDSRWYEQTVAEVWFDSVESAEAAGYRAPGSKAGADESFEAGPFAGSALPLEGGAAPTASFTVKGNADSMLYHTPDSRWYDQTVAEVWFRTAEEAEAAGFAKPGSKKSDAEEGNA
ncbi:MAG: 50S ribosomal protein L22 [Acidimicrobiia bacterium]